MSTRDSLLARVTQALKDLNALRNKADSPFNALRTSDLDILDGAILALNAHKGLLVKAPAEPGPDLVRTINNALIRAKVSIDTVTTQGMKDKGEVFLATVGETLYDWVDNPEANLEPLRNAAKKAKDLTLDTFEELTKFIRDLIKKILGPLWWVILIIAAGLIGYVAWLVWLRPKVGV